MMPKSLVYIFLFVTSLKLKTQDLSNEHVASPGDHCSPPLTPAKKHLSSLYYGHGSVERWHLVAIALKREARLCGVKGLWKFTLRLENAQRLATGVNGLYYSRRSAYGLLYYWPCSAMTVFVECTMVFFDLAYKLSSENSQLSLYYNKQYSFIRQNRLSYPPKTLIKTQWLFEKTKR